MSIVIGPINFMKPVGYQISYKKLRDAENFNVFRMYFIFLLNLTSIPC